MELANRLFFKLYQSSNMLHKTGTKAVEAEGLTTQQWAVLGALSRPDFKEGMSVGDLARYLMVSRQNLAGVVGRLERDGRIKIEADSRDRRSRLIKLTEAGRRIWNDFALPKIHQYYERTLEDFSTSDLINAAHYLIKLLDNMEKIDSAGGQASEAE